MNTEYFHLNADELRNSLVTVTLEWEKRYGVAPAITNVISEYDAAIIVGHTPKSFGDANVGRTAVTRGTDFVHNAIKYQIKANRPSGKPGSKVTIVAKASNYEWDKLIWILYDREYNILEAWEWEVIEYRYSFHECTRISPSDMRKGKNLLISNS